MARKASSGDNDLLGKGSIVVFEGPSEIVCTQLRLLPASPHILVLPGLQSYLPDRLDRNLDFENYIRHIHNAAAARYDAAVDFIRAGSPNAKRLVFLNGGTARAYAMCIQYISDHECHGNIGMAESRLQDLLGGGPILSSDANVLDLDQDCFGDTFEERIINVMRAAEALDEKTSDLQSEPYSAASIYPRPRSMSLPVYGFTDRFGDLAAFYMFGSPLNQLEMDEADETTRELFSRANSVFASATGNKNNNTQPHSERPVSPTETVSSDRSSCWDSCVSPTTPYPPRHKQPLDTKLVETWASDLRVLLPLPVKPPQRTRSLQFRPGKKPPSHNGRPSTPPSKTDLLSPARAPTSDRPISCIEIPQYINARLSPPNSTSPPKFRTSFTSLFESQGSPRDRRESKRDATRRESLRRESMPPESIRRPSVRRESRRVSAISNNLLPFTEDMVVFFRDETRDNLLERVVTQFQGGVFPCVAQVPDYRRPSVPRVVISRPTSCFIPQPPTLSPPTQDNGRASSPQTRAFHEDYDFGSNLNETVEEEQDISETVLPLSNEHLLSSFPPTPVHTPPICAHPDNISSKFHILPISITNTAVSVQNSLRSILDAQFPRGEVGYQQFCPMLPELNGLWKPVFRESESNSGHPEKRKVDFILALGAQNNVNKNFSQSISRKLEQLGTRPSGDSRSGRLDLRYLIVNAMQAFTSQRLLYQTEDNPFTNPYLLASLVIPHLETFLAAHSHIRYLLLDYPPDHLTTILAVQKMIGSDIMKVAQIFDASKTNKVPFNPLPTQPPSPSTATNYTSDQSALSRANLLLSSAAAPSEVESFIHAVSSVLVRISPFYDMTPEEDCPPLSPAVRTPLKGPFSPFPRRGSAQSTNLPPTPISSARGGGFKLSRPPKGRDSKGSIASRSISPISKMLGHSHDNSPVIEIKVSEIDDSDFDDDLGLEADERRLLPMFLRKKPNRLATSDKAMRFLGLA